jgi:hypothetical protein
MENANLFLESNPENSNRIVRGYATPPQTSRRHCGRREKYTGLAQIMGQLRQGFSVKLLGLQTLGKCSCEFYVRNFGSGHVQAEAARSVPPNVHVDNHKMPHRLG